MNDYEICLLKPIKTLAFSCFFWKIDDLNDWRIGLVFCNVGEVDLVLLVLLSTGIGLCVG